MFRIFSALLLTASIGAASSAYAAKNDFKMQEEKTITLKSGKTVKVMVGKMHGKMMVVIPMDDLNEILMRSEGHSMATP